MIASLMPDIMGILAMSVTNSVETSSTIGYTQIDRYGHVHSGGSIRRGEEARNIYQRSEINEPEGKKRKREKEKPKKLRSYCRRRWGREKATVLR